MKQTDLLQEAFDRGEALTVASALSLYGIYALSQRCGDLRRDGYPVESEMIALPNGKHCKQYRRGAYPCG